MKQENNISGTMARIRLVLGLISLLLLILLYVMVRFEARKLKLVYNHETQFNQQYLYLLQDYLQQNLYVNDVIRSEYFRRNEILIQEAMEHDNTVFLDSLIMKFGIKNLSIINPQGQMTYSYPDDIAFPYRLNQFSKSGRISIYDPQTNPRWIYLVSWHHGYWYISQIPKQKYLRLVNPITFEHIFRDLNRKITAESKHGSYPMIAFIAIQDTTGIINSGPDMVKLSAINKDRFLQNILRTNVIASRRYVYHHRRLIETAMPFMLANNDKVIIRIGTTFDRIEEYKRQLLEDLLFYFCILMLILFLGFVFYRQYVRYMKLDQAYQLQSRLSEIGKLSGEVAHEIKNPLQNINLLIQRIDDYHKDPGKVKQYCDMAFQQIDSISSIVDKFLAFSRIVKITNCNTNIHQIVTEALHDLIPQIEANAVEVQVTGSQELEWILDSNLLKNILTNLLKNSLEAYEGRRMEARIIRISWVQDIGNLQIRINDNAGGIQPDLVDKIQDLYFTTKQEGHGIGLPICMKYVESMRGKMEIFNHYPEGMEILISFPKSELNHEDIVDRR